MLFGEDIDIFQGAWVDWEMDGLRVITLSSRNAVILGSFISILISFAGTRLWSLLSFGIHQLRSNGQDARDGLHHQRQVVLRNTASATGAAWHFIRQAWAWRCRAKSNLRRSAIWVGFTGCYSVAFSLVAIFAASEITVTESARRLIKAARVGDGYSSKTCGFLQVREINRHDSYDTEAITTLYDNLQATTYAQECYNTTEATARANCKLFTEPFIPWVAEPNAACPFSPTVCRANVSAFRADTGPLSSRKFFGINSQNEESVLYRKVLTCIPLTTEGFVSTRKGIPPPHNSFPPFLDPNQWGPNRTDLSQTDTLYSYHYGSYGRYGRSEPELPVNNNITAQYLGREFILGINRTGVAAYRDPTDGIPYHIETRHSFGSSLPQTMTLWRPREELMRNDADVTAIFLAANDMMADEPIDDPVFAAHKKVELRSRNREMYRFDNPLSPIGCITQYEICNPVNGRCSNLSSVLAIDPEAGVLGIDLSPRQRSVAYRIRKGARSLEHAILGRAATLRASLYAYGTYQTALDQNHWHSEVASWFNTSLAMEQLAMQEFATPSRERWRNVGTEQAKTTESNTAWMCEAQMTSITKGTVNISERGLVTALVLSCLVIFASFIMEDLVSFLQRRYCTGQRARRLWIQDGLLQLQRMALDNSFRVNTWTSKESTVPVTERGELFHRYGGGDGEMPLIAKQELPQDPVTVDEVERG